MRFRTELLILVIASVGGCRSALPRVPSAGPADALNMIAQRVGRVHTLSAHGVMTIRSNEGESVHLRVALAASGPDRMRLRAWKLGHAALDMTVRGDEVWLWTGDGEIDSEESFFDGFFLRRRLVWLILRGGAPDRPGGVIRDSGGSRFSVLAPIRAGDHARMAVVIDRPTLTVREYRMLDGSGSPPRRVRILAYRIVSGAPLPAAILAEGRRGALTIEFEQVYVNPDLKPAAFEPSPRAGKLRGAPVGRESDG